MDNFRRSTDPAKYIAILAVVGFLSFAAYIVLFFYGVNSTLTDYTWGDNALYNQMAYNFTHGRPFQSTMLYLQAFAPAFSQHVNFTPYLVLWLYKFIPTVNGLYVITILFNTIGFVWIGWLIAREIFPQGKKFVLFTLVSTVFFCMLPFPKIIIYKGLFPLFAGPFPLAMYYFFLRKRPVLFITAGLLLCGVSEDMAMFAFSLSLYFFIYERQWQKTALLMGMISLVYLALVLFVIQPAARAGITTLQQHSFIAERVHCIFNGELVSKEGVAAIIKFFGSFLPASAVLWLLLGLGKNTDWRKIFGVSFIAPLSHWLVVFFMGSGQHELPIISCAFLALLLMAAGSKPRPVTVGRIALAMLLCAIFIARSFWIWIRISETHHLTISSRETYLEPKILSHQAYFTPDSVARMKSNVDVLHHIAALPPEAGVCFWVNRGLVAFVTARNNAWLFPYFFDSADYLVIQKDADQTFFSTHENTGDTVEEAIKKGQTYTTGSFASVPAGMVELIKNDLVYEKKSHEIIADSPRVLILKRKSGHMAYSASTIGFGWMKNIWRKSF